MSVSYKSSQNKNVYTKYNNMIPIETFVPTVLTRRGIRKIFATDIAKRHNITKLITRRVIYNLIDLYT